jgi:glycosyltransferase involved in cell wall biosynthesis
MRLGIDASNLREGGGLTHLAGMLHAADPAAHGFTQASVWGGAATLAALEPRPWLVKSHQRALDGSALRRIAWQRLELAALARAAGCDALFVPGGASAAAFHPVITMSRNMLPFEWPELARYRWSATGLRLLLLRATQAHSFRHCEGLIFLTQYARDAVLRVVGSRGGLSAIVPHGVDARFRHAPRPQLPIERYDAAAPLRLLYVSAVELYKHQRHVANAVAQLRAAGLPVRLELVGGGAPGPRAQLARLLERLDPRGEFLHYSGPVPYAQLPERYLEAQVGVFASSCENMPNILLEAMASGLPLACSRRGPMPEVLGDAGVYFDPERPADIAGALRELLTSPPLRARLAQAAYQRAQRYSWERCAAETLQFLGLVARTHAARRALPERC